MLNIRKTLISDFYRIISIHNNVHEYIVDWEKRGIIATPYHYTIVDEEDRPLLIIGFIATCADTFEIYMVQDVNAIKHILECIKLYKYDILQRIYPYCKRLECHIAVETKLDEGTVKLLKMIGFKEVGIRHGYYKGEDCLLLDYVVR